MGMYRTILEEDQELGGVLDDNNSMDMAEIDQVVEDHDANEDEQTEAQAAEFGPTDDVDEIMDESMIVVAEAEMNFNSIMMAIGVHEISEAAAGRDVLYENALTDYFKKAKEWVVNFFKKVWSVLKRYANNIASVFHTNKGLATKKKKEIEDGYSVYQKDKGDNHLKLYPFTKLDKYLNENYWKSLDIPNVDKFNSSNDVDSARTEFRKSKFNITDDDFREGLKKEIYGEKAEKLITGAEVVKILGSGDEVKKAKKAMDTAKKQYKEAIGKFNDMEKKLTREASNAADDKKAAADKKMAAAVKATQMVKNQLADLQVVRAVTLSAARTRMVQARTLAHAYIGAYNKSKDKDYRSKLESSQFGFLGNVDLI